MLYGGIHVFLAMVKKKRIVGGNQKGKNEDAHEYPFLLEGYYESNGKVFKRWRVLLH